MAGLSASKGACEIEATVKVGQMGKGTCLFLRIVGLVLKKPEWVFGGQ